LSGLIFAKENLLAQRFTKQLVVTGANFLPFRDKSFDLIPSKWSSSTCASPRWRSRRCTVCSRRAHILLRTPNLANYQVFANRILGKIMPRSLHVAFVGTSEKRHADDIYPTFIGRTPERFPAMLWMEWNGCGSFG
jgi:hypothetical protein